MHARPIRIIAGDKTGSVEHVELLAADAQDSRANAVRAGAGRAQEREPQRLVEVERLVHVGDAERHVMQGFGSQHVRFSSGRYSASPSYWMTGLQPRDPSRSVHGVIRATRRRSLRDQGSSARRERISSAVSALTISSTSALPSSGPPSITNPSLASAFMKAACELHSGWPSNGCDSRHAEPRVRMTAKSGILPPMLLMTPADKRSPYRTARHSLARSGVLRRGNVRSRG